MLRKPAQFCFARMGSMVFVLLILVSVKPISASGQEKSLFRSFSQLSRPEKWWVVTHPFIAAKTFRISEQSSDTAQMLVKRDMLDGDIHGGQVDAFKHAFWMAMLVQHIRPAKARKLGKAHEKGDYLNFKQKLKSGQTTTHDQAATEMDLFNNKKGIEIGLAHKNETVDALRDHVIDAILKGDMMKIRKDQHGNSLSATGDILPTSDYKNKWETKRVLVPSDEFPGQNP